MTAQALAREAWHGLLDVVWPPKCLVCGAPAEEPLCDACRAAFVPLGTAVCARCGVPAPRDLCAACAAGKPRYFSRCRGAGRYEGALREAVLRLKYDGKRRLAEPLGAYLADCLADDPFAPDTPDVVVPVPLHPSRERSRGFNQSALLARLVASRLCLPLDERSLRRVRRTRPQAELNADERAANIRDAFAVTDPPGLAGRTVLLIDDVVTTCHTVDECARALVDAGARAVLVAGVARGG